MLPAYDGSGAALGNASSSTVLVNNTNAIANAALVLGSSNATALNISSNGSAGSYSASLNSTGPSGGYYSGQQGYDLVVASRTIATPGSAVGDIKLASDVNWTNGTLNINAVGTIDLNSKNLSSGAAGAANFNAGAGITNAGSVNVGRFDLQTGTWNQVAGSLPTFSAADFRISGGTFVRALGGDGTSGSAYQLSDVYGLQGAGSAACWTRTTCWPTTWMPTAQPAGTQARGSSRLDTTATHSLAALMAEPHHQQSHHQPARRRLGGAVWDAGCLPYWWPMLG